MKKPTSDDYQPFGKEWESEMMKMSKRDLVFFIKRISQSSPDNRTEEDILKGVPDLDNQITFLKHVIRMMEADPEAPKGVLKYEKAILENLIALRMLIARAAEKETQTFNELEKIHRNGC